MVRSTRIEEDGMNYGVRFSIGSILLIPFRQSQSQDAYASLLLLRVRSDHFRNGVDCYQKSS